MISELKLIMIVSFLPAASVRAKAVKNPIDSIIPRSILMSKLNPLAAAIGAAVVSSTLSLSALAGNPFQAVDLSSGYQLADGHGKSAEGKCGEGKCGEGKDAGAKDAGAKDAEGKCGEGKCGEGKCGEGKCGEGKCGEDKDAEGKCGEGKCGGKKEG
jgi:uncharacterized low-complexity protein